MNTATNYAERIKRLKERKAETGYSCQQIANGVEAMGGYTSLSTVKKVFSPDAADKKFKDITLRPIEEFFGIAQGTAPVATPNEAFYQGLINELTGRLKAARHSHTIKNAAIVALVAIQVVWLFIDMATPGAGWFGSDLAVNWYIKLATVVLFCIVAAVYVIKKKRKDAE